MKKYLEVLKLYLKRPAFWLYVVGCLFFIGMLLLSVLTAKEGDPDRSLANRTVMFSLLFGICYPALALTQFYKTQIANYRARLMDGFYWPHTVIFLVVLFLLPLPYVFLALGLGVNPIHILSVALFLAGFAAAAGLLGGAWGAVFLVVLFVYIPSVVKFIGLMLLGEYPVVSLCLLVISAVVTVYAMRRLWMSSEEDPCYASKVKRTTSGGRVDVMAAYRSVGAKDSAMNRLRLRLFPERCNYDELSFVGKLRYRLLAYDGVYQLLIILIGALVVALTLAFFFKVATIEEAFAMRFMSHFVLLFILFYLPAIVLYHVGYKQVMMLRHELLFPRSRKEIVLTSGLAALLSQLGTFLICALVLLGLLFSFSPERVLPFALFSALLLASQLLIFALSAWSCAYKKKKQMIVIYFVSFFLMMMMGTSNPPTVEAVTPFLPAAVALVSVIAFWAMWRSYRAWMTADL